MKTILLITVALGTCAAMAAAQQQASVAPPLALNTYVSTKLIHVPPVADRPFSAAVVIRSEQPLPDGSVQVLVNLNLIGRDSRGRTHGESRSALPEGTAGEPRLVEVVLYDPETRVRTAYYTRTHMAEQHVMGESQSALPAANPLITTEDLGYKAIEGLMARGTRRTFTIPASASGTGKPLAVVDEYWYSEDLQLNLRMQHTDPRIGTRTFTVTQLRREEPDASFFTVPEGYRFVKLAETTPEPQE